MTVPLPATERSAGNAPIAGNAPGATWTRRLAAPISIALLTLCGCQPEIETGVVTGVVSSEGEPLNEVLIYFMPDPDHQTPGAMSTAVTDTNGQYRLEYGGPKGGEGAVVGWHRVTLEDLASENFRGSGRPPDPRIPPRFMNVGGTPLRYEIKPGEQKIDIDIPPE